MKLNPSMAAFSSKQRKNHPNLLVADMRIVQTESQTKQILQPYLVWMSAMMPTQAPETTSPQRTENSWKTREIPGLHENRTREKRERAGERTGKTRETGIQIARGKDRRKRKRDRLGWRERRRRRRRMSGCWKPWKPGKKQDRRQQAWRIQLLHLLPCRHLCLLGLVFALFVLPFFFMTNYHRLSLYGKLMHISCSFGVMMLNGLCSYNKVTHFLFFR